MKIEIENMCTEAKDYSFIVIFRECYKFWFWGAYNNLSDALRNAIKVDGIVFTPSEIF